MFDRLGVVNAFQLNDIFNLLASIVRGRVSVCNVGTVKKDELLLVFFLSHSSVLLLYYWFSYGLVYI